VGLIEHSDPVYDALAELVRLKDGPRDDAYRATKDAAWEAARAALNQPRGVVEENARLREALAHATTAVRDHATRLWQVAYEADRAAGK
jgi:hypothetical protein